MSITVKRNFNNRNKKKHTIQVTELLIWLESKEIYLCLEDHPDPAVTGCHRCHFHGLNFSLIEKKNICSLQPLIKFEMFANKMG